MADPIRVCSLPTCSRKHYGRGYCTLHWQRWKTHGDPNTLTIAPQIPRVGSCSVGGCRQKVRNQGLCANHYQQKRMGRTPMPRAGIPPSLPGEEWRPLPGTSEAYGVSNLGRVRSVPRLDRAGRPLAGRILAQSTHPHGYRYLALIIDGKRQRWRVHQLVAGLFIGPRPAGLDVCHNDGDPSNNRVENLRYDTASENNLDAVRHGTHHWAKKTHCPSGHAYAEHAYSPPSRPNARYCRQCQRNRQRRRPATRA